MVGRGLREIVGWSFADPGLLDRLRLAAGHPLRDVVTVENPLSEDAVDDAPHAARLAARRGPPQRLPRRCRRSRSSSRAPSTVPADGAEGPATTPADEHQALGALLSGAPAAALLARRARRGGLLRRQGAARRAARQLPAEVGRAARRVRALAVPASRPQRRGAVRSGAEPARSASSARCTRSWRSVGPRRARPSFVVDLGKLAAAAPEVTAFEPSASFPALRQDIAVMLPGEVPAERAARGRARGRRRDARAAEVFDVYTGEQVGEGRRSLALALAFRSLERP